MWSEIAHTFKNNAYVYVLYRHRFSSNDKYYTPLLRHSHPSAAKSDAFSFRLHQLAYFNYQNGLRHLWWPCSGYQCSLERRLLLDSVIAGDLQAHILVAMETALQCMDFEQPAQEAVVLEHVYTLWMYRLCWDYKFNSKTTLWFNMHVCQWSAGPPLPPKLYSVKVGSPPLGHEYTPVSALQ